MDDEIQAQAYEKDSEQENEPRRLTAPFVGSNSGPGRATQQDYAYRQLEYPHSY